MPGEMIPSFTLQNKIKASVNAHLSRWFEGAPILKVAIVVEPVVLYFPLKISAKAVVPHLPNHTRQ